jgi:hypothetical protein
MAALGGAADLKASRIWNTPETTAAAGLKDGSSISGEMAGFTEPAKIKSKALKRERAGE